MRDGGGRVDSTERSLIGILRAWWESIQDEEPYIYDRVQCSDAITTLSEKKVETKWTFHIH